MNESSSQINKVIAELKEYAQENNVPIIMDISKDVLADLIIKNQPKTVLEIGTAIGYSGLVLLSNSNAHLTTIEKDAVRYNKATQSFLNAGVSNRVTQVHADAAEFLQKNTQTFDFVFLDGPKGQYIKYLPYIIKSLNPKGIFFADNVLFKGMVKQSIVKHKHRTIVMSLRSTIAFFENNPNFESVLLSEGDGILIAQSL